MLNMQKRSLKKLRRGPDKRGNEVLPRSVPKRGGISEADLLREIKRILDVFKNQGFLAYRRIHVMPVMVNRFATRPNNEMSGMEDLQVALLGGKTLYWELKSPTGKQSESQIKREAELKALGHNYTVIRSTEQALSELRAQGLSLWCFT